MYVYLYAIEQTGGKESGSEREKNQHVKNGFISGMELMPLQSEKFLLPYLFFFCFTVQICDDDNGDVAGDKAVQHVIDDSKFVSIAHLVYIKYALSFGCGEHETVGLSSIVICTIYCCMS